MTTHVFIPLKLPPVIRPFKNDELYDSRHLRVAHLDFMRKTTPTQVKCLQKNTGNKPPLTSSHPQSQWALSKKWRKTVIFWQKNKRKVLTLVGQGAIKF